MYFAARFGAHPDSDVEILSNPSISSIEILDQFSRPSSRKPSEDRRYVVSQPAPQQQQLQLSTQLHYPLMQPQQGVASDNQLSHEHSQSVDTISSDWHSSSRDIDSNLTTSSSANSDVEELIDDENLAGLMHRQTSTDDLDTVAEAIVQDESNSGHNGKAPRKMLLTGMNLTESSSSGSVTDSVCTAYEQQQTATDVTKSMTRDNNGTTTITTTTVPSSMAIATPVTVDNRHIALSTNEVDEKNMSASKSNDISTLSTMIGGEYDCFNFARKRQQNIMCNASHSAPNNLTTQISCEFSHWQKQKKTIFNT